MSLREALKLARVEVASLPPAQRLGRIARISRLFVSELIGTVAMAPYGYRALRLYHSLCEPPLQRPAVQDAVYDSSMATQAPDSPVVYSAKDISYGDAPRAVLDVYTPAAALQAAGPEAPVVLFCHGGVWAAGAKWHYAPMAVQLAKCGIVAVVMQYTLYPDALAPQLVDEVSQALNWVFDNVGQFGGDPRQVSLVGHSAGAHMCMMALLYRARTAHAAAHGTPPSMQPEDELCGAHLPHVHDARMPQRFVAVTGVYDISKHYTFEHDRGVSELSTMKPAIGGFSRFASMSPSVILDNSLQQSRAAQRKRQQQQQLQQQPLPWPSAGNGQGYLHQPHLQFYVSFPLHGEAIAHRIGLQRACASYPSACSRLNEASNHGMEGVMEFPLEAAAYLPSTVLMSSCTDMTVPWYESAEMFWRLYDCGVPVKHLVYNKVGHGDFVVHWEASQHLTAEEWNEGPQAGDGDDSNNGSNGSSSSDRQNSRQGMAALQRQLAGLPTYAMDLAAIVSGMVDVEYAVSPAAAAVSNALASTTL